MTEGVTWRKKLPLTRTPTMPEQDAIEDLPGTWLFLGPLLHHFGHFLVESIARVWALDALDERIDGVLFTPHLETWSPEGVEAKF